jgi:hypothetical protein
LRLAVEDGRSLEASGASSATGYSRVFESGGLRFSLAGGVEASMEELMLTKFDYHLDESDPDVLVLRRRPSAFLAAISARGATK